MAEVSHLCPVPPGGLWMLPLQSLLPRILSTDQSQASHRMPGSCYPASWSKREREPVCYSSVCLIDPGLCGSHGLVSIWAPEWTGGTHGPGLTAFVFVQEKRFLGMWEAGSLHPAFPDFSVEGG